MEKHNKFMFEDGVFDVTPDMDKDRMWQVLEWALNEIQYQREAMESRFRMEKLFREAERAHR